MKEKIYTTGAFLALTVFTLSGCSASVSTNVGKPATNAANANATNSAPKTNSNTSADKKPAAPSERLKDEKKPENEKGKSAKNIEVPKDSDFRL